MSASLHELIDAFAAARAAFLATPDDDDNPAEWDAYCKVEDAIINYPCQTIEGARLKARFFLDNPQPHETLRNCVNDDDGWALDRFLRSLLGEVRS
ncbi:hypothetical protein ASD50_07540 [Mesorhizobium sp. Root552]|jgi:hypothetical protein|uniref:hypothetical protein n=1 Tax=Mesorhizobium sp. Root552 TaxID=1736555 RepID=UPI0006F5BB1E|nr:hypothetical protein [Mesorhizobium sp. Root552]KQZ19330.1 hypothetical protein ASD50_07540 [Mesorhizobium sp. Root552]